MLQPRNVEEAVRVTGYPFPIAAVLFRVKSGFRLGILVILLDPQHLSVIKVEVGGLVIDFRRIIAVATECRYE